MEVVVPCLEDGVILYGMGITHSEIWNIQVLICRMMQHELRSSV